MRDPEVLIALRTLAPEESIVVERNADLELDLAIAVVADELHPFGEPKAHADQCAPRV